MIAGRKKHLHAESADDRAAVLAEDARIERQSNVTQRSRIGRRLVDHAVHLRRVSIGIDLDRHIEPEAEALP